MPVGLPADSSRALARLKCNLLYYRFDLAHRLMFIISSWAAVCPCSFPSMLHVFQADCKLYGTMHVRTTI